MEKHAIANYFALILALILVRESHAFATVKIQRSARVSLQSLDFSKDPKQQQETFQEKLDRVLDTQFFDPEEILENESPEINENPEKSLNPLVWFANLVRNDYQTAEALFAAGFISLMVVISQELLRMAKYGDAYHPFQNGSAGSLF